MPGPVLGAGDIAVSKIEWPCSHGGSRSTTDLDVEGVMATLTDKFRKW